jgi:glycine C-acetyltransferase
MNIRYYLLVIIPVLLWAFQTASIDWFQAKPRNYSSVELVTYRALGALLFALAVGGVSAFRGLRIRQFTPGVFLAFNFIFFNLALRSMDGPLLMTIEASNFVFCLPILWLFRRSAQISAVSLIVYLSGMGLLAFNAYRTSNAGWGFYYAIFTSLTFALFNCTVEFAGKSNNRSVPLMLPVVFVSLVFSGFNSKWFGDPSFSWDRFFSLQTLAFLILVGFVQTGVAYYCWTKASQRFSSLTLALAFLWTVPIAWVINFVAHTYVKAWPQKTHGWMDFLAIIILCTAFIIETKHFFPRFVIRLGRNRTKADTLKTLKEAWVAGDYQPCVVKKGRLPSLVNIGNRELINFASSDYLGLGARPEIQETIEHAVEQWGWGVSSSRTVAGTHPMHDQAEQEFAGFLSAERAILFPSAYTANLSMFEWMRSGSIILYDQWCHGSLKDGMRLSNADRIPFDHSDLNQLEELLNRREVLDADYAVIVTDGVFSQTGEVAQLKRICDLSERYGRMVFVDDSHGTGVMGHMGRGTHEAFNCLDRVDLIVTSLTKALGCPSGGILAGREPLVEHIRRTSHSYHFSNAISPIVAVAGSAAIKLVHHAGDQRRLLNDHIRAISKILGTQADLAHPSCGLIFESAKDNRHASRLVYDRLKELGVLPSYLAPPYTSGDVFALRFQFSVHHSSDQLSSLGTAVSDAVDRLLNSTLLKKPAVKIERGGILRF